MPSDQQLSAVLDILTLSHGLFPEALDPGVNPSRASLWST